jgi:translation initiation factor eIF-2B subunit delta
MDLRRPPRSSSTGVEPKIRQVGFFTPDPAASGPSEAPATASAAPQLGAAAESPPASDHSPGRLSPVMIPPPRHADHLAPCSPSPAGVVAVLAASAPAASPARFYAASVVGDDDAWSRAPSFTELGNNPVFLSVSLKQCEYTVMKQGTWHQFYCGKRRITITRDFRWYI